MLHSRGRCFLERPQCSPGKTSPARPRDTATRRTPLRPTAASIKEKGERRKEKSSCKTLLVVGPSARCCPRRTTTSLRRHSRNRPWRLRHQAAEVQVSRKLRFFRTERAVFPRKEERVAASRLDASTLATPPELAAVFSRKVESTAEKSLAISRYVTAPSSCDMALFARVRRRHLRRNWP